MKQAKAVAKWAAVLVLAVFFLFPVILVILCAFKTNQELYAFPIVFIPKHPTLENFTLAFSKGDFGTYVFNTALVTVASTAITIVISLMAGFALVKYQFKGRVLFALMVIGTMLIPIEIIMVPIFKTIKVLGMFNSLWGIIIPPAATPAGVFLVRQYLLSVPDDLLHAARIDGASEWRIFTRIIAPISVPVISVLGVFSFMWRWNDYLWPLIVIFDPKKYTIQLAINNFVGEYNIDWNSLLAMSVLSMIPVLIIFLIFQKKFMSGMATAGMKD